MNDEHDPTSRVTRATIQRRMETITLALTEGIAACDGDVGAFLAEMPTRWVHALLEHLPTVAGPWRVVDMKRGEPTCMERLGWGGEPIAVAKARGKRWLAYVGNTLIEAPEGDGIGGPIDWPTCDAARAACDGHMAREGIRLDDIGEKK